MYETFSHFDLWRLHTSQMADLKKKTFEKVTSQKDFLELKLVDLLVLVRLLHGICKKLRFFTWIQIVILRPVTLFVEPDVSDLQWNPHKTTRQLQDTEWNGSHGLLGPPDIAWTFFLSIEQNFDKSEKESKSKRTCSRRLVLCIAIVHGFSNR